MVEDPLLQLAELRRWIEAELLERRARLLEALEGVRLPPGPIEREHVVRAQPLAVWIRGHERVELRHERAVAPVVEICGDPRLERRQTALLQARRLRLGEGLVRDVRERRPAPERERLGGRSLRDEPLEPLDVQLPLLHAQQIAGRARDDAVGAESLSQCVHVHLQRARAARRRLLAPDAVQQTVHGDDLVRVQQEQREQRPRPLPTESHRPTVVVHHLQRPQQPELHSPFRPPLSRAYVDRKRSSRGCSHPVQSAPRRQM